MTRLMAESMVIILAFTTSCSSAVGSHTGTATRNESGEFLRRHAVEFTFDVDGRVGGRERVTIGVTQENTRCQSGAEFTKEVAESLQDGTAVEVTIADGEIGSSDPPSYGAIEAIFNC